MKRAGIMIAVVLVVALVGGGVWYYITHGNKNTPENRSETSQSQSNSSSGSPADNSSQPSDSNGQSTKQTYQVSVYFSKHPDSDNDPSVVFPVTRTSSDLGVATFAVAELLKGPSADESQKGYFSTAKLRGGTGTNDFKVTIANGTATLQFLKPFDHLGVVADGQAESELNTTLKQFPNVQKVVILNSSGDCEFDLSGQNRCLQ